MHTARHRAVGAAVFTAALGLTIGSAAAQTAPSTTETTELDVGGGGATTSTTAVDPGAGSTATTQLDVGAGSATSTTAAVPNRVDAGGGGTASRSVPATEVALAGAAIVTVAASAVRVRRTTARSR